MDGWMDGWIFRWSSFCVRLPLIICLLFNNLCEAIIDYPSVGFFADWARAFYGSFDGISEIMQLARLERYTRGFVRFNCNSAIASPKTA